MKLNEREKYRIKYSFSGGSWDKVFSTIEDILETHLAHRTKLTINYMEAEQKEKTGGGQRDYWDEQTAKAYEVFLTLPEKVKAGRHLAEFKQALKDKVAYSPSTYKKKYEAFVKRYKEENTPEAKLLKELDRLAIEQAYEIEPPLG